MIFKIIAGFISCNMIHSLSYFTESSDRATIRPVSLRLHMSCWGKDSAVWLCLSRAQHLGVSEENIMNWLGCKSEQHLLPGLWRVVWGQQHQISHRSYLLHSSLHQFVLAADRTRERERKNRLFIWETGNAFSMSCVFAFFCALGLQREISHWCWR